MKLVPSLSGGSCSGKARNLAVSSLSGLYLLVLSLGSKQPNDFRRTWVNPLRKRDVGSADLT
jgi:hypothetical protein